LPDLQSQKGTFRAVHLTAAESMHIADGILPVGISVAADAVALAGVYASSRNLDAREIPRMGISTTAMFVVSLIHLPLGGTSIHLGLYGLAGMILGARSFPCIVVNLLFQSLIFQHGGLLSVGVNSLTMGSGALLSWLIWDFFPGNRTVKSFACGLLGILLPAFLVAFVFLLLHYGKGMLLLMGLYIPAAVVEGALSLFIYLYIDRVQPEIFTR
jgi:cobalt/nickel transport system permease protein